MATDDLVQGSLSNHLFLMKIAGFYPFDSHPVLFKLYSFFSYIVITLIVPILAIAYFVVTRETDFTVLSINGSVATELILIAAKLLPLKINPKKIVKTVMLLNQKIFKSQLPEQDCILLNVEQNSKFLYKVFSVPLYTSAVIWLFAPLMYKNIRLPIDIWLPLDPYQNVFLTSLAYLWIVLCIANASVVNVSLDSMVAILIYHAIGQLRVLKDTLIYLGRRAEEEVLKMNQSFTKKEREEMKNRIIYQRICECIHHHNTIYDFVQDIEETFTYTVFGIFLFNIMVIGTCIFQLSIVEPFSISFIKAIFFTKDIFLEQFLFCYFGELLNEESIGILDAIYTSEWYDLDEKSKRALITLMERAKRPMTITAGKLLELSLETFLTLIRRAYSLFAVLKNF